MSEQTHTLTLKDNISTDDIIPANRCANRNLEHLKRYAFEHVIGEGNLIGYEEIVAGHNFGCGSSREEAPVAIKAAGVKKVRAYSFGEIFYRNSINVGLELEIIDQPKTDPLIQAIIDAGGLSAFNQKRHQGQLSLPTSIVSPRPMTMVEKMLARASGNAYVKPGMAIFIQVDLAMSCDTCVGPVAEIFYENFGEKAKLWNQNQVVLVADHLIHINDLRPEPIADQLYQDLVQFAKEQDCQWFDVVAPGQAAGICHILLPEKGFVRPGMVVVGTDSHTCTFGAFGCFGTGVGTTEMANVFAMGDTWIRLPETLLFELEGFLPKHISAKDIILFILGKIGCEGGRGKVMEFRGSIIDQLPIDERMTLCNMATECGALCGLIAPDKLTLDYVQSRSQEAFEVVVSDPDAEYEQVYRFDLSNLEPQVARPYKPDQVSGISELAEVPITRAYIGSCTGGKLFDIAEAAEAIKGYHVASGVSLFVVPASQEIRQKAEELGYLKILEEAGAQILKSGCGACINAGLGVLGKEETGVYAINRNFKGRSGDPSGKNYLASPRVVAISAVKAKITDQLNEVDIVQP
ncbi:aconitase/3-isopropylmalate dehydratase large subunit family protein [Plectonema radiosum]|nr:aconitase/3-isopropylmalate dehydratase large subunit family protein [Plectonema radiosum]